ncbi:MAG TPA: hypothetical protein VLH79_09965 [Chthonomonadales bacterium]|nr:hypothetical protein [Chthonomonadales bacterium]
MSDERRDLAWLRGRLAALLAAHFRDVPEGLPIDVRWGRSARRRFGSIVARDDRSLIVINGAFRDPDVPAFVVDATLAHELAHYAHGFGSGLPRLHEHPHRGDVVGREVRARGLEPLAERARQWEEVRWPQFVQQNAADRPRSSSARAWEAYLSAPGKRDAAELEQLAARVASAFGLEAPPFAVRWLPATLRHEATSYYERAQRQVALHGLLADRRVPEQVAVAELAYWTACAGFGAGPARATALIERAGLRAVAVRAERWRRAAWTSWRRRHHPLARG